MPPRRAAAEVVDVVATTDRAPQVTIVGAGMAGLAASLRLLQRGFEVTLVEQDDFMGGMMRACTFPDEDSGDRHEHSYHMVTNWYLNLWDIIDELGLRKHFTARDGFAFLSPGEAPKHLNGVGSPANLLRNVLSGVAPPADLFVFAYSMIDLLATRIRGDSFLGDFSVNGFLAARPYITERAALLHQRVWETVWAIPSYDASAVSYQSFLKYGNFRPNPGMWLFNTNKYDALIGPIERTLRSFGDRFRFRPLTVIEELELDQRGNVVALRAVTADRSPSLWPDDWQRTGTEVLAVEGDLILAATPGTLARLATGAVFERDPRLGDVRKLQAEPMASVELHLRPGRFLDVPDTVSVLMDSRYEITFLDYSQLWHEPGSTFLYVTASDISALLAVPSERRDPPPAGRTSPGPLFLDLQRPTTAIEYLLAELSRTVPLDVDDIDLERTRIQTNTGEELFANEVGSQQWRPGTTTRIGNLFLAGAFCRNYADVATIEGAVASGLSAAEEVRARAGVMPPITVKTADHYHELVFGILKWMWAPYAYGAKAWSMLDDMVSTPGRNFLATYVNTWRRVRDPGSPSGG